MEGSHFVHPHRNSILNTWEAGAHTGRSLAPIEVGLRACFHEDRWPLSLPLSVMQQVWVGLVDIISDVPPSVDSAAVAGPSTRRAKEKKIRASLLSIPTFL